MNYNPFIQLWAKNIWWTLVHKQKSSRHSYLHTQVDIFFGDYISALRGFCPSKFLNALQTDQVMLAHTPSGTGVPQKILIVKI